MTFLLFAGCGVSASACGLYTVLALRRPIDWKYLSFAALMGLLFVYLLLQKRLYGATTPEMATELSRSQGVIGVAMFALFGRFVCDFTGWRLPRALVVLFWTAALVFFVLNLVSPYSLFFARAPSLSTVRTLGGETVTLLVAPPSVAGSAWYLLDLGTLVFGVVAGIRMALQGRPGSGGMLALAAGLFLLGVVLDIVHQLGGRNMPYTSEFGVVLMSLVLSVQLALDFRATSERLARMYDAALQVRDKLNTPLQTLELGLKLLAAGTPESAPQIERLQRAATRIADLGRMLQRQSRFD